MSKTNKRQETEQFRKEFSEAMSVSPTRRAQEERAALRQVRDFLLETQDDMGDEPLFGIMGDAVVIVPHSISDEYETNGLYSR